MNFSSNYNVKKSLSPLLFNTGVEVLSSEIGQMREIRRLYIVKEEARKHF